MTAATARDVPEIRAQMTEWARDPGFTRILAGLVPFLRPGGHIAITIRPWREHAELIDLPSQILACGLHAGLIPVERCVALLARAAEHDLVARVLLPARLHPQAARGRAAAAPHQP